MTDNQTDPEDPQPDPEEPQPEDPQPDEPEEQPHFGETRLVNVHRDGKSSVEVEIYTGAGWISFEQMLNGDFSGGDESSDQS